MARRYDWLVLNQSQSVAFQAMMGRLARELGPGMLLTGMPHPQDDRTSLRVERAPSYARGAGSANRAASWLAYTAVAARCLQSVEGRPFVLAVTNPPMLPHLAWLFRRMRGLRYGLLIWDIYPEHIVRMGWAAPSHPLVKGWEALNRHALREAELIVTLGHRMAKVVEAQAGPELPRPVEVIPNWADTNEMAPRVKEENAFARAHGQVGKVTVLYSGNMGAAHGLLPLVNAAADLKEDPNLSFMLIGDGLGRAEIEDALAPLASTNVVLLDYQPWDVIRQSIATADIAVVVEGPGSEGLSVPSKTYNALATGAAILALTTKDSDLADLVEAHDVGRVCPPDDPRAIAETIRQMMQGDALSVMRANARRVALEHYSADAAFRRWLDVLAPAVTS